MWLSLKTKSSNFGKYSSFTSDRWSSKYSSDSFLDIDAIWIEDEKLKCFQIEMLNLDAKHTRENIRNY